jgi:hypothetical protein
MKDEIGWPLVFGVWKNETMATKSKSKISNQKSKMF